MSTQNTALQGSPNVGVANLPPKQQEESEAAVTASPIDDNPAGQRESVNPEKDNSSSAVVDPGTDARVRFDNKTNVEEKMTTSAPAEDSSSDPETAAAENTEAPTMTADELMAEHVGEVPKAEKKFSLASLRSKSEESVPKSNTKPGTITVGKPNDDTFVRTSTKHEERAAFDFVELKTEKKQYLLTPDVVEEINALNEDRAQVMIKTMKKRLIFSVTRLGDPFLWPITIMDDNDWIDSANTCADTAQDNWLRLVSNMPAGRYDYVISPSNTEPKWPAMTYEEAVLKAFDGKVIDSMGHDVIKQLLGED